MADETLENNEEVLVPEDEQTSDLHKVIFVQSMYREWFLDYASYVILDRAFPDVYDGLKPVQRQIGRASCRERV